MEKSRFFDEIIELKRKKKAMHDAWQLIAIIYTIDYLEACRRLPWLSPFLFG